MAILEASTSTVPLRVAECPYPDCGGARTYYKLPGSPIPIPIDNTDVSSDTVRAKYPVGTFDEQIEPKNVTINRTKELIDMGLPTERYQVTDSFTLAGESFEVDAMVGFLVRIDYPDEQAPPDRYKVVRKVASNTVDTITLQRSIPAEFSTSLADVNVLVLDPTTNTKSTKEKARKSWEQYIFTCPECGKLFYVDKP